MSQHAVLKPVPSQKPKNGLQCKIAFVFDFPTNDEARLGKIMTGSAGRMFNQLVEILDIGVENCLLTYAISTKPAQENPAHFFHNRADYKAQCKTTDWRSKYSVSGFGYLKEDKESDVERLANELNAAQPNIIIAMGSLALWALTGLDKVGTYRGTILNATTLSESIKVLPTYSPSAIVRNYDFRPIVLADIKKAILESESKEIKIIERELWIEPTIEDLQKFEDKFIQRGNSDVPLSFDIETASGDITCIGFAPSDRVALVIPFRDERQKLRNYWTSYGDELKAWDWIKKILEDDKITKVAQNQTYDVSWLQYKKGIRVAGVVHDTMHAQHSLQPEQQKGLGYLGSIYTNEGAWKTMAKFSKSTRKE